MVLVVIFLGDQKFQVTQEEYKIKKTFCRKKQKIRNPEDEQSTRQRY